MGLRNLPLLLPMQCLEEKSLPLVYSGRGAARRHGERRCEGPTISNALTLAQSRACKGRFRPQGISRGRWFISVSREVQTRRISRCERLRTRLHCIRTFQRRLMVQTGTLIFTACKETFFIRRFPQTAKSWI